jgi:hypothetical protein
MNAGQFFGVLLIAAGALVAGLCGLCTIAIIGVSVSTPGGSGPQSYGGGGMIPVALLIGGIPTLFGCLMVWAGIVLFRSGRKPPAVSPKTFD